MLYKTCRSGMTEMKLPENYYFVLYFPFRPMTCHSTATGKTVKIAKIKSVQPYSKMVT